MDTEHDLEATVIDLTRIAEPARQLVAIYDSIRRGDRPTPGRLDTILGQLGDLPRPPGQLGADMALLANGGDGHDRDREHVVAAIERLRRVSSLGARPAEAPEREHGRARRTAAPSPTGQLELPGISSEGTTP